MPYQTIVMSSGHGKYIRGARGNPVPPQLDEVDEARRVVDQTAIELRKRGVDVTTYHDDVSRTQSENLKRIVDFHNGKVRQLDVSVHFNAYQNTQKPMGCEVLYVTQQALAGQVSKAIADVATWPNRGAKKRTDLYFLNNTAMPAILLEICFVDSSSDAEAYKYNFASICAAIANVLGGRLSETVPPEPEVPVEPPVEPPPVSSENSVDIVGTIEGEVTVIVNGEVVTGLAKCRNVVRIDMTVKGEVTVTVNGQDMHNKAIATASI